MIINELTFEQADSLRNNGLTKDAIAIYKHLYSLNLKNKKFEQAGIALQMIGVCYKIDNDTNHSILWLKRAAKLFKSHHLMDGYGNTLRDIGITYEYVNKFTLAKKFLVQSEKILRNSQDKGGYAITCSKIGLVSMRQKKFDEAINWIEKGIELSKQAKHWFMEATSLWHMGELQSEMSNYKSSLESLKQSMSIFEAHPEDSHSRRYAQIYGLMAYCYSKIDKHLDCTKYIDKFKKIISSGNFGQDAIDVIIKDTKYSQTVDYLSKK